MIVTIIQFPDTFGDCAEIKYVGPGVAPGTNSLDEKSGTNVPIPARTSSSTSTTTTTSSGSPSNPMTKTKIKNTLGAGW
jgi:hypothetical protein